MRLDYLGENLKCGLCCVHGVEERNLVFLHVVVVCQGQDLSIIVTSTIICPNTRPALPRTSSSESGFFFCGIRLEPVATASASSTNPNSADAQENDVLAQSGEMHPQDRERRKELAAKVAIRNSIHAIRVTAEKPSSRAIASRSSTIVDFRKCTLDILGHRHIAVLAEGRYYADSTRSIDSAPLAGFFHPEAALDRALCDYFATFEQVISYIHDPDGLFGDGLRKAGVKKLISASPKITEEAHAARQLARPLEQLALRLERPCRPHFSFAPRPGRSESPARRPARPLRGNSSRQWR